MAEKSGFFNAILVDGESDRKYNANDYCDNLAVIISNGVLRSENDDLKVTAAGMVVSVAAGRAWIDGHYYMNDSTFTFGATPATVGAKRYDRVMLRLDKQLLARKVSLVYVQGTEAATPTKPAPTRNANVYDLVLADIYVEANKSTVTVTDTRADTSICGWIYSTSGDNSFFTSLDNSFMEWFAGAKDTLSSVTLFKRYTQEITLQSASSSVSFNIPQYDPDTCFLEVYVNGILDNGYTLSNMVITFDGSLIAGTKVTVNCYKSIDGTGIMTVSDEITQLQNQVATIIGTNKFVYTCTGLNDNIALSEIAQAIYAGSYTAGTLSAAAESFLSALGGNTYLAGLQAEAQIEIDVVGTFGATTPAAGAGTVASRYRWFNFGISAKSNKRLIFDFAKCQKITLGCAGNSNHIIFYGTDMNIRNANVYAYSQTAGANITMFIGTGNVNVNDCHFSISTAGDATIAEHGTFTNCICIVRTNTGNGLIFNCKSANYIRVIGGTFYAYSSASGKYSAVFNIDTGQSDAVIMAYNVNCPQMSYEGFSQYFAARTYAGMVYINGIVTTIGYGGESAYRTVNGSIAKNKNIIPQL